MILFLGACIRVGDPATERPSKVVAPSGDDVALATGGILGWALYKGVTYKPTERRRYGTTDACRHNPECFPADHPSCNEAPDGCCPCPR